MADPIQGSSRIPIPSYQTLAGTRDPLPVSSPKLLDKTEATKVETRTVEADGDFKDYLDEQSVTTLEKQTERKQFDTVDFIAGGSPYGPPPGTTPL